MLVTTTAGWRIVRTIERRARCPTCTSVPVSAPVRGSVAAAVLTCRRPPSRRWCGARRSAPRAESAPSRRLPVLARKTSSRVGAWISRLCTGMFSASSARTTGASSSAPSRRRTPTAPSAAGAGSPNCSKTRSIRSRSPSFAGIASTVGRPISALSESGVPSATIRPGVDDAHALGQRIGLLEVLRGQEDRDPMLAREACHLVPEGGAALDVESRRGLVEEEDPRLVHERKRQVEAALHSARVAADLSPRRVGEPDPVDQLIAAPLRIRLGQPVHPGLKAHVLASGEERVERGLLERDADRVADVGALADHVVARDPGGARGGGQERRQHVDRRRLACAVRAEKAVDLAGLHLEVDPVDRPRALLELADEAFDFDSVVVCVVGAHYVLSNLMYSTIGNLQYHPPQ